MEFWKAVVAYYEEMKGTFTNIPMEEPLTLLGLVAGAFVGVVAFILVAHINKYRTGSIVDTIIKNNALTPETAISPEKGGFNRRWQLDMLQKGSMLRKAMKAVDKEGREVGAFDLQLPQTAENGESGTKQSKGSKLPTAKALKLSERSFISSLRFYIPENSIKTAKTRFSKEKITLVSTSITILVTLVLFIGLYFLLPIILRLLDNIITMLG